VRFSLGISVPGITADVDDWPSAAGAHWIFPCCICTAVRVIELVSVAVDGVGISIGMPFIAGMESDAVSLVCLASRLQPVPASTSVVATETAINRLRALNSRCVESFLSGSLLPELLARRR
jgi:hypothetical protein